MCKQGFSVVGLLILFLFMLLYQQKACSSLAFSMVNSIGYSIVCSAQLLRRRAFPAVFLDLPCKSSVGLEIQGSDRINYPLPAA